MSILSNRFRTIYLLIGFSILSLIPSLARTAEQDQTRLARQLQPLLSCLSGQRDTFTITAEIDTKIDGNSQRVEVRLVRFSDESFDLDLKHKEYIVQLRRRADATAMVLPLHDTVFLGQGGTDAKDSLAPCGITGRLISSASNVSRLSSLLGSGDTGAVTLLLRGLLETQYDDATSSWKLGNISLQFSNDGNTIDGQADGTVVHLVLRGGATNERNVVDWPEMQVVELDRGKLERQLVRGVRRALEILLPAQRLIAPPQIAKKVEHGELRWIKEHRVALLYGTPEQIGRAHGELLRQEATRCIDSVLHTFGTLQTIRTGRWFRHDLEDAYAQLAPHIPERHKAETRALAASLGLDDELVQVLNVFPELFHCSGFAVYGQATIHGKLYHGRVLDYMTTIGLQDAATTFIVAPDGHHAFANVGYAGFIGSVSGLNTRGISLGEMGGRGEGHWDGVPMATLMRRALEECSTLDEVTALWSNSPRTCEYYYVFADGKTNQAVGVAATPENIQFIWPGQSHELLGPGIADAVVLSAGSRLETLSKRISQRYGQIDADVAQSLMSRPVAMQSNLHNVLFVPADGVLYVANASHNKPAAERPYVRLNLNELLKAIPGADVESAVAAAEKRADP